MTLYLDNNATTPLDPRVRDAIADALRDQVGNAGSPHEFGERAKRACHAAREQIAAVVDARRHEIVFTSGATESNNLAILGLAEHGLASGRRHIVSTQVEHHAVLAPLQEMERRGFEVTLIPPSPGGSVDAERVVAAVRPDTLLVSVMQVNNETGVAQPVAEIADRLAGRPPWLHVDAAQGFGKDLDPLRRERINLISVSAHKINGPQGVGALVVRRSGGEAPPLTPVIHGGGQELGLRSGTLPTSLIIGFGLAAELAAAEWRQRRVACEQLRGVVMPLIETLGGVLHGDPACVLPHVANVSFPGWDSQRLIEALAGVAAVSDGAACTSVCATASHVLSAMGVGGEQLDGAVRFSWSHLTDRRAMEQAMQAIALVLQSPAS